MIQVTPEGRFERVDRHSGRQEPARQNPFRVE